MIEFEYTCSSPDCSKYPYPRKEEDEQNLYTVYPYLCEEHESKELWPLSHEPKPILFFFKDYSHPLCRKGHRSAGEESTICEICDDLLWQSKVKTVEKTCKCCGNMETESVYRWNHMGLMGQYKEK